MSKVKLDPKISFKKVKYCIPTEHQRHMVRVEYEHEFRRDFLESIADNHREELIKAGLWDSIIDRTLARGKTPPGWGVHHKLPIHGGGQNSKDNMVFIRFADHFQIHRYIDTLIEGMSERDCKEIEIPYPKGDVFVPSSKSEVEIPHKREESEEERKARVARNRKKQKREYEDRVKN